MPKMIDKKRLPIKREIKKKKDLDDIFIAQKKEFLNGLVSNIENMITEF